MDDLKKKLTKDQYRIAIEGGTEPPFDNAYWDNKRKGIYVDVVTDDVLFLSSDKFDSGTGWPSFTKPIDEALIVLVEDNSHFMHRLEVRSKKGNTHLGHVFSDGPIEKGGKRYCMNSASLKFIPLEEMVEKGYGPYIDLLD